MARSLRRLMLIAVVAGALACSKKTPVPAPTAKAASPKAQPQPAANEQERVDPNDTQHGTRKRMGLDSPVYVDGAQVAILRAGELPPIPVRELEGGGRRYKIYDYLKGIGAAPESIRSIHLHGNSDRIASIEGAELLKEKDRFEFSFLSGDSGTPLQRWDTDHLKNEFVIHEIRRVTVYVKKPSPAIHPQRQCHVDAKGACTDEIPYATGHVAKGTRVYVDGKMVGFVKRRFVTDAMRVGAPAEDPSETTYSLSKLVADMGVDLARVATVELVAGDEVVARATGAQFTALAPKTNFTLPKHQHGKVRVLVPAEIQAARPDVADRDALVSSVLLYEDTAPTTLRELVPISADTDLSVQLAAVDDARNRREREEP